MKKTVSLSIVSHRCLVVDPDSDWFHGTAGQDSSHSHLRHSFLQAGNIHSFCDHCHFPGR